jgi:hypothetical protein
MWRWPLADPREVVDLAGAGTLADGPVQADLSAELRHWRGIVARRRLVALIRRQGAIALALAALLEILSLIGLFPQWVVVAVPLAGLLVSVTWSAAHGPSPFGLARLLDDKLGLNDRLATALEIVARGGDESALERRTVDDAAALLRAGREDWHASPARAGREWWAALGAVLLLAVVIGVGATTGSGSSSGPTEALGPNGGAGAPGGPNERKKKEREEKKNEKHLAPTGKLHKFKGKNVPPSQVKQGSEGYQKIPQGYKTNGKEVKGGKGAKGGAAGAKGANATGTGAKHVHQGAAGAKPGGTAAGEKSKSGSGKGQNEAEHPTVGFNVKGKKHGNHGRKGNSEVSGGGGKKAAPNGQGDESSSSASQAAGAAKQGSPTGGSKAGGEQGNNSQGHATPITGQASQSVKIQPGYAPSRASKGGKEKKQTGYSQGAGGKARTGTVTGGTQVGGEEFSYVPAAGGAVAGPSAGLQRNYLESLKWVERLPW